MIKIARAFHAVAFIKKLKNVRFQWVENYGTSIASSDEYLSIQ